jgi:uncharacterized cysteine cluster protein YcgN (CxxCxxCC family)
MQQVRLPIVHSLLGRLYSDAEWEALCNRCGKCCYESREIDGRWVRTGVPCRFLDVLDKTCDVYTHRFQAEEDCTRVTPSVVLQGILPDDCSYHDEVRRIVEEDFDGDDPRHQRRGKKQRKKEGHRGRRIRV